MTRGALKIATIGGGSSYTPELIEGYIKRKDELPIKEIWLVDIEAGKEKLEIVGAMAKRMIKAAGLDWEVHLTLDREAALKGADFVSTQFRVGLLDARIKDERIPLRMRKFFKKFRQNLAPLIATSGTLSISNQSLITGSTQKRFQPPRNYRNRLVER